MKRLIFFIIIGSWLFSMVNLFGSELCWDGEKRIEFNWLYGDSVFNGVDNNGSLIVVSPAFYSHPETNETVYELICNN